MNCRSRGMNSCMRYPGGKSKESIQNTILGYIPDNTLEYRECFLGGGGIYFGLSPKRIRSRWINDINENLMAVYLALRDRPIAFIDACRAILPPQEGEETISTKTADGKKYNKRLGEVFAKFAEDKEMDQALRYFFINRTVWGGRVTYDPALKSRMYYSNPEGWNIVTRPNFLESISQHLQDTKITVGSYEKVLKEPGNNVWIYCDPPYLVDTEFAAGSKLYEFGFTKEDHERFAHACSNTEHKICISYDDNGYIRELFKGWNIYEHSWKYCGTGISKKKTGKELIITNYQIDGIL